MIAVGLLIFGAQTAHASDGCSTLATTLPGSYSPYATHPISLSAGEVITTTVGASNDFFIESQPGIETQFYYDEHQSGDDQLFTDGVPGDEHRRPKYYYHDLRDVKPA
ncbi:MAG: hypothetical protein ACLQM6_04115, partial [Acidobacteriaceae bacterium]